MTSVTQSIQDQYDRLPDGERKIADVLLGMQNDLAAYSATELAARAGVSKATATRLVRRLGFEDFQQMRQHARESRQAGSSLAALPRLADQRGTLGAHLDHDISRLVQTLENLPADQVRRAVDILTAAERLWVIGFRNSHALALYARTLLVQVKPDVRLLPAPGQTVAEELSALTADDAVLMLGFRRRPPILTKILRSAGQVGVPVVLLCDPSLGAIEKWSEVTLRCLTAGSSLFDSYVAPVSLINYLCAGVATALGDDAQARLRRTEQLHDAFTEL
jgi:DNA-binding MurR/RpiR family transcriptional regulator